MKMIFTNQGATINLKRKNIAFKQTDNIVAGISVLKTELATKIEDALVQEEAEIKKIIKRHPVDYIFACDIKSFKQILKNTEVQEIEVDLFLNKKREMMPYTTYGVGPALLIISQIK